MTKFKHILLLLVMVASAPSLAKKKNSTCEQALAGQGGVAAHFKSDPIRAGLAQAILAQIQLRGGQSTEVEIVAQFGAPPKPEMGQIAFPVFQLAKALKAPPPQIAAELAVELNKAGLPLVGKVQSAGPYVNFHIDFSAYLKWVLQAQADGSFLTPDLKNEEREKISLEFSQPNTHKALHVGHMRNMLLGESIARLLEVAGHQVVRSTYPGDMGTHVAKVLWYIRTLKAKEIPQAPSAEWLGKMYAEADQMVKDSGDSGETKAGVEAMLKRLESRQGEEYEFYRKTREWSLEQMRDIYAWLDINFDHWYFESECDEPSRQLVLAKQKEGLLVQDDGAIGLDLKAENLGFVLMLKRDGSGLYLTKDLELLRQKFSDAEVTRSIVVVDARQRLHFQQVFRSAEILGFHNAKRSKHLSYETVTDSEGKAFSSRSLNAALTLGELKTMLGKQPDSARAVDNLRWGFLRVSPNDQIRFDLEQWMSRNGNSAGELVDLVRALEAKGNSQSSARALTATEQEIVAHIANFQTALTKAVQELDPSEVARYLTELQVRVAKIDDLDAGVAKAAAHVLVKGLEILGIRTK
jgi:arginyl-tRNA synthetase